MSPEQYANEVADNLKLAARTGNRSHIEKCFNDADFTIRALSENEKNTFWQTTRNKFNSPQLLLKEQSNEHAIKLIQIINDFFNTRTPK